MKLPFFFNTEKKSHYTTFWLLLVFVFVTGLQVMGQTTGEYRSVTTGDWTTLTSWERYNGIAWATPTTAITEGWPGQYAGTKVITIRTGHVVTIGTGGITTQAFTSLNIQSSGQLYLTGTNATITFSLSTSVINIAQGGSIYFFNKSKLVLSADAALTLAIAQAGLLTSTCNNNAELWIGSQKYAVCSGAPGDIFTFSQVISSGGTLNSIPTSNSPICQFSQINLTGNYAGAVGTTTSGGSIAGVTYSWSVTAPGGAVTTYNTQNVTISNAVTGTYQAKLTVTTYLSGTMYTNSETIPVVVNPLPTLQQQHRTGLPATIHPQASI